MPRARSRSSMMASLALRCAASTSSRARSRSAALTPDRQLLPGQAQLHRHRHHLGLRPVVQVALDPAQPGRRVVHRAGPALLQFPHPVLHRRPEQPGHHPLVEGVAALHRPRRPGQRGQAARDERERDREGVNLPVDQERVRRPPLQPARHVDHDAVGVPERPPDRERQVRDAVQHDVEAEEHAEHRQRQLQQQVGAGPPAGPVGQQRPEPASAPGWASSGGGAGIRHPIIRAASRRFSPAQPPGHQRDRRQQRQPDQHAGRAERQAEAGAERGHDDDEAGNRQRQPEDRVAALPPGRSPGRPAERVKEQLREVGPAPFRRGRPRRPGSGRRERAAPGLGHGSGLLAGRRLRGAVHDGTPASALSVSACAARVASGPFRCWPRGGPRSMGHAPVCGVRLAVPRSRVSARSRGRRGPAAGAVRSTRSTVIRSPSTTYMTR